MLNQQTNDYLRQLRLHGMLSQLEVIQENPSMRPDSLEEGIGMLVDAEIQDRNQRRQLRLMKSAKLKYPNACIEDINFRANRQLDKGTISSLSTCGWIDRLQNLIISGPTGVGKTWLGCAFGNQAIRKGKIVMYKRLPRLLEELEVARGDGSLPSLRIKIAKSQLLILDDWALAPITQKGRHDLLEIVEDKIGSGSILITSQLPVDQWHDYIGDPTVADAILDRLIHRAHRLEPQGDSMRKQALSLEGDK